MLSWILFAVALIWALVVTFLWLVKNPLPFPDWGHRCFSVPDEKAARVVAGLLARFGLSERFTFDPGLTQQTLLADGTTVLIYQDENSPAKISNLPPNAISVVVANPRGAAVLAMGILQEEGFEAQTFHGVMPELEAAGRIAFVTSNAFNGWILCFRRHLLRMGGRPRTHQLT